MTDKEMREAFESVYFQAHQYRKTLAGINGYCSEYHEIYDGFQAAYQLQQRRVEELERRISSYKSLVASQEKITSWYRQQDYSHSEPRLKQLEESLESEREMNANLTAELETALTKDKS